MVLAIMVMTICFGAAMIPIMRWLPMGRTVAPPVIGASLAVLCLVARLIFHVRRRGVRATLARQVDAGADTPFEILVRDTLTAPKLGELTAACELVGMLAARGRVGQTIRACQPSHAATVAPITVPFEALPLDESDPSFAAITSGDDANDSADDDTTARRIKRTVKLKGGWIVAGLFAFQIAIQADRSYMQWQVTWELLLWVGLTVMMLFGSAGAWTWRKQWLAVPGGLLVRKAGWQQRAWNLHLFRRDASVLLVHEFNRSQWFCVVGDTDATERTRVTKDEAHFLLRAWLSPVEPPPLERLTDLR